MATVYHKSEGGSRFVLWRDRLCDQTQLPFTRMAAFGTCKACPFPGGEMIVVGLPTLREAEAAMREHIRAEHGWRQVCDDAGWRAEQERGEPAPWR